MHPLTVYKASAGSGKTFTLAVEFIKLLILNPRKYENILAVTFTNKATEEMKHRIVSQLYGLSHGLRSSDSYLDKITKELDVSEDFVRKNAAIALHNLLHNYNQFRVQTIDAFFQSILRNMVKELGLGNNLRISLNDSQVISEAVDSIMETLDKDKALMSWIIEYVNERMDDQKSWDITGEVKSFGMNLSKEFFKSNEHLLKSIANDKDFFKRYKKAMTAIIRGAEAHFKECGEYFLTMLSNAGYDVADLAFGKTGVAGYFLKLKDGNFTNDSIVGARVLAAMNDPMKWGTKKNASEIAPLAESLLIPYLIGIEKERQAEVPKVRSAQITLKNINKMRLLFSIREEMDRLNKENARFMLSNTQMVLSQMIQEDTNIAPFIYEKIGAYLQHIMIDEFQDTSTVQWNNFKVLLANCMAGNEDQPQNQGAINNLIVGDVKQSIYRFRSGDWRLLNSIEHEFGDEMIKIQPLATNWRSERNIISFNNHFFKQVCNIEADSIMPQGAMEQQEFIEANNLSAEAAEQMNTYAEALRHAYDDVAQDIPAFKPSRGLVRVELLPEERADFIEAAKIRTLDYIQSLIIQGVKPSEIAILVRYNSEASDIAQYFAENAPELSIVSEQAFTLEASPLVTMIISMLRLLRNAKDKQAEITLVKLYIAYILGEDLTDGSILTSDNAFKTYLPQEISSEEAMEQMRSMSLYELSEYIYRTLNLSKLEGQAPYATAFFDGLKKYMEDNIATIEEFLDYWDSELHSKAISVGSGDSIRVITIHKSKGLEFKHLVMPFCNWNLAARHTETLWCTINEQPFSELPFIPVDYTSRTSLQNSIYEPYGIEEWMQGIVDNLNLLYVAFTRAGRSLFVIANQNAKEDNRSYAIIEALRRITDSNELEGCSFEDNTSEEDQENASPSIFTFGEHYFEDKEEKGKESDNVFDRTPTAIPVSIESYDSENISFRQSNKSREFAADTLDDNDSKRYTTIGSIMHMLFSRIHTTADIDKELRQFEFDGVIYDDTITAEELRNELKQKFCNTTISSWFSDKWTVFNECNIMQLKNGKIVEDRPDRVITDGNETIVIDYKFGNKNAAYAKQVQRYMNLMQQMGYPNVKGYLWYVNLDEIESVK